MFELLRLFQQMICVLSSEHEIKIVVTICILLHKIHVEL